MDDVGTRRHRMKQKVLGCKPSGSRDLGDGVTQPNKPSSLKKT